jgi:hypothetical protein
MKKIIKHWLLITFLMSGCSSPQTPKYLKINKTNSVLTEEESIKLNNISLNNEFLSGCVTYELSVIADELCDDTTNYCIGKTANKLTFNQWVKIYNTCIVTP